MKLRPLLAGASAVALAACGGGPGAKPDGSPDVAGHAGGGGGGGGSSGAGGSGGAGGTTADASNIDGGPTDGAGDGGADVASDAGAVDAATPDGVVTTIVGTRGHVGVKLGPCPLASTSRSTSRCCRRASSPSATAPSTPSCSRRRDRDDQPVAHVGGPQSRSGSLRSRFL